MTRRSPAALALIVLPLLAALAADDTRGDPLPEGAKARLGTARLRHAFGPAPTAMTPDGKFLVAPTPDGAFAFLDPATGKVAHTARPDGAFGTPVAFSADGTRVAAAGSQESLVVEVRSGKVLAKVGRNTPAGDNAVSLAADGKRLAVGGTRGFDEKDRKPVTAVVWDVDANRQLASVAAAQNESVFVALSADGRRLATWGNHYDPAATDPPRPEDDPARWVQFWDVGTGKETGKARLTTGFSPAAVAFAPDGALAAASTGEGAVHLIDPATGTTKALLLGRSRQGRRLAFSPDGKTVASAGEDGSVQRWNVADGRRLGTTEPPVPMTTAPRSIAFADAARLVAWGPKGMTTVAWEVPSGKLLTPAGGHFAGITGVALAAGGKEALTAAADGSILRWEAATGKELGPIPLKVPGVGFGPGVAVGVVTLSPDGTHALALDAAGGLAVYDLPAGTQQFVIPGDAGREDRGVFTPDGARVVQVLSSFDPKNEPARVAVWDVAAARRLGGVELPGVGRAAAAVSPDGKTLVTAGATHAEKGNGRFAVTSWELATGKKLGEYSEDGGFGVASVATAGDNRTAVVVSPRNGPLVIDYLAGTKLRTLDLGGRPHPGVPVFAPDGKTVALPLGPTFGATPPASAAAVLLIDTDTGKTKKTLGGMTSGVSALAFSADGKTLVTGSGDTTALVWDLSGP